MKRAMMATRARQIFGLAYHRSLAGRLLSNSEDVLLGGSINKD
jgi:hypothetical protein